MNTRGLKSIAFLLGALSFFVGAERSYAGGFFQKLVEQKLEQRLNAEDSQFSLNGLMSNGSMGLTSLMEPIQVSAPTAGTFDQLIDPLSPSDTRTFKQRYFVNSSFASGPDAPVLYSICGESVCHAPRGAILTYARQYGAYVVALEHRFYGQSQPFPTLSAENLKYLRTELALADLARFQAFAQTQWGMKGKWISFGGSYPGSLSAYYRQKYPNNVVGALASSAPVQAQENFEEYDWVVHDRVGPQCANAIQDIVAQIEIAMLKDSARFQEIKKLFRSESVQDPVDFLYIVADMGAAAVQYGMKDFFCGKLLRKKMDPIASYAEAGVEIFARLGMKPEEDSFQAAKNEDPNAYAEGLGTRQWLYQSCTEYGYFQNAYHDPSQSARSSFINPAFHNRVCQELFGTAPLNTSKIMQKYYAPLFAVSTTKIHFTNGSIDPWATLSISTALGNATNPALTTDTIQGAAHCDDLGSPSGFDSRELTRARRVFTGLLQSWLN